MFTLTLLCGAGIGMLLATCLMFLTIRSAKTKGDEFNKKWTALMQERNEIDRESCNYLNRIAAALETK